MVFIVEGTLPLGRSSLRSEEAGKFCVTRCKFLERRRVTQSPRKLMRLKQQNTKPD
ncbi:hypothetical protein DPMN_105237 [Dreissena polymorpha]|uniref:Uncharacterized protein n=1 Tax=Dreissena polymorpha TaxID=45954 RepID=A0A9D4K263_DREPO|nr:hypothetical protein DPMN_105237 [Dreissena polymorpha]